MVRLKEFRAANPAAVSIESVPDMLSASISWGLLLRPRWTPTPIMTATPTALVVALTGMKIKGAIPFALAKADFLKSDFVW